MIGPGSAATWPRFPEADRPPEERGLARDAVRLLVSTGDGEVDRRFADLPTLLRAGDLLVVNDSATVPASLPARGDAGEFLLNLSTEYGPGLWLAEPRWGVGRPGPLPLRVGDRFRAGSLEARVVGAFPGIPRLRFVRLRGNVRATMARRGRPIRYGHLAEVRPLADYQTIFARSPGSAEMPSAGRPFTPSLLDRLRARGISVASITLHTGVSSLELEPAATAAVPIYPEPFEVPVATVEAIAAARCRGGRIFAVGTTVVRALESTVGPGGLRPGRGFTRLYLHPGRSVRAFDGLLTGLHDARSTHLALMAAVVGADRLESAYRGAAARGYLWHEFGDSHLILPEATALPSAAS